LSDRHIPHPNERRYIFEETPEKAAAYVATAILPATAPISFSSKGINL
jgi:hypothetical protein